MTGINKAGLVFLFASTWLLIILYPKHDGASIFFAAFNIIGVIFLMVPDRRGRQ